MPEFVGGFFVLHGLVFLLYAGHSWSLFELQPGMVWPDGSWAFSKLLGEQAVRVGAAVSYVLTALGFAAGGIALIVKQVWWYPVVLWTALLSTLLIVLFWDGTMENLADEGGVGLLINLAIVTALFVFGCSDLL